MSTFYDFTKFSRVPWVRADGTLTPAGQEAVTELGRRTGSAAGILFAADIANTPSGGISATDVQAALNEIDFEKQTKDATLTGFAALSVTADTLPYGTGSDTFALTPLTAAARALLDDATAADMRTTLGAGTGNGTVTTASVTSANGFGGSVATATTTPAISITTSVTGLLKGNGTAVSAAVANTDYVAPGGNIGAATGTSLALSSYVATGAVAVASLPAAATAGVGARHFVTDANATTFNSVVANGGANKVPVFSDGTNWRIG